jgi:hypothetical protein
MPANASNKRLSRCFLQVFKPTTTAIDNNLADNKALKIFSCYVTALILCNLVSVSLPTSRHKLEQL